MYLAPNLSKRRRILNKRFLYLSARNRELHGAPRSSDIMMRPTPRSDSSKVWLPVNARDLGSMKEGQTLLKTLEGGMWKWHVTQPGDGRTRSNFQCNGHEDCKRELRVVQVNDDHARSPSRIRPGSAGVYMIQGRGSCAYLATAPGARKGDEEGEDCCRAARPAH